MKIHLYRLDLEFLDLDYIKAKIHAISRSSIILEDEFFHAIDTINYTTANELASIRVYDYKHPFKYHKPDTDSIDEELEYLSNPSIINNNTYDGFLFQELTNKLLNRSINDIHIILTTRLLCTFNYEDYRYHLRSIIFGHPSIISISGIVEAPAKPKEYYLMAYSIKDLSKLDEMFKDRIIGYDHRINEVIIGFILQVIAYYKTGYPFCNDKRCRLYNAHWHEELIGSQLNGRICKRHEDIL